MSSATKEEESTPRSTRKSIRIVAVQPRLRRDDEDPLEHASCVIDLMKKQKEKEQQNPIDLWILPELCPIGYSEHTFETYLNEQQASSSVHDKIQEMMQQASKQELDHAMICFGCIGRKKKKNDDESNTTSYTIRQMIVGGGEGVVCSYYDKISICDYGDCNESRYFESGHDGELVSFSCHGFQIGILICADIRNPWLATQLTTAHLVDVLIQPSCFSRDCSFYSWKSFRETRAMENQVYFVGINYAGENFGESSFNPPWIDEDHLPTIMNCDEGCLVSNIHRSVLDDVRSTFPYRKRLLERTKER